MFFRVPEVRFRVVPVPKPISTPLVRFRFFDEEFDLSPTRTRRGKKKRALVRLQSCRPGPPGATMAATHESLAMLAAVRALDLDGVASDVEIEETRAALRDAREMLANPLAYPPREEKDRAVVRQGAVEVRGREVRLGALDIENALVLRCVGVARSHRSRLGRRANVPPERET